MIGEWRLLCGGQIKGKRLNTYREMVKFSEELTNNKNNSLMPAFNKYGPVDFRFMFRNMMREKGYVFVKDPEHEVSFIRKKKKRRKISSTGIKGCYYEERYKKYRVQISVKGKKISLGRFDNIDDAFDARKKYIKDNDLTMKP
tara:strand:- start:1553 stop:1981 length:429 start_codon:yes stop_codon:yes gene_type:complete